MRLGNAVRWRASPEGEGGPSQPAGQRTFAHGGSLCARELSEGPVFVGTDDRNGSAVPVRDDRMQSFSHGLVSTFGFDARMTAVADG